MPNDDERPLPPRPDAETLRQMLGALAGQIENFEEEPPTAEEIVEFERLGAMSEKELSAELSKMFSETNQTVELSKTPGAR